jgi:hypothetical protein
MLSRLRGSRATQATWAVWRRHQVERDYIQRRETYAQMARERGLVYRETDVRAAVRARLKNRGYAPHRRRHGEIHTFAFVPRIGWHSKLLPDLQELGTLSIFDYVEYGYDWREFARGDARSAMRRREMNAQALAALKTIHARRPVDWVFVYASGLEVRRELLRSITEEFGVPLVSMCLDDKQSWTGPLFDGQRLGQIDIAPLFDLSWTSATVACDWYLCEGARPLYLPEGFDMSTHRPLGPRHDIPVSFVGAAYGYRPFLIRYLRDRGIGVRTFGAGWAEGCTSDPVEIFNRSEINLGMGGVGYSEDLTNVKARDFEVPATGGGVYVTSFNPDLARHFTVGLEIICYRTREELVELVRYYLAHPDEARLTAARGRERCLAEHRWLHRYLKITELLGITARSDGC